MDRRGFLARLGAAVAGLAVGVRALRAPAPDPTLAWRSDNALRGPGVPCMDWDGIRGATYEAWNCGPLTEPVPAPFNGVRLRRIDHYALDAVMYDVPVSHRDAYTAAAERHRAALARLSDGTKLA